MSGIDNLSTRRFLAAFCQACRFDHSFFRKENEGRRFPVNPAAHCPYAPIRLIFPSLKFLFPTEEVFEFDKIVPGSWLIKVEANPFMIPPPAIPRPVNPVSFKKS